MLMKRMMLAGCALVALGGCATGQPYTGVEAGPAAVAEIPAAAVAPAAIPVPNNILLADWTGPYGGVPAWDKVRPELFSEAFQFGIDEQRREVAAIVANRDAPTFANTIVPQENAGQRLGNVQTYFGVMTQNMSTPAYQALNKEWSPKLSAAFDEITLNPELFQRVKAVYDSRDSAGLDAKQHRLVTRYYESFVRNGANLDPQQKAQLSEINQQLATRFASFSDKLLADEEKYTVATAAEIKGLPQDLEDSALAAAKERKLPAGSYAIVNTRSAVDPLLTYADNRALREKVWRSFVNRGDNGDASDTNATIAEVVKLRADRARLLGFPTHAHWRMQDTMAKEPQRAMDLMMRVWPAAVARVKQEVADMTKLARKEGFKSRIEAWDYRYYQEKVRKARYDLSQEELKPYFQLDNMLKAMFWSAGELYGYDFKENTGTVPVFHPDIRTFEVTDRKDGGVIGQFYLDTYARTGKRSGAWHSAYRPRIRLLDDLIVLNSNNNNFTKPAAGKPVLISLDDADTLFHEFGHGLHYLTLDVTYPTFAGSQRDFVEYPSQVNENWLMTPEVLSRFAINQAGQPIPQALVDKIEKAKTFNQGFATVEYLSSALVDMKMHLKPDGVVDADAFEATTLAELGMPREMVMRHRLPQFNHLFSSDSYSAGYYSYLWSEVMDADTWAAFEGGGNVWDKKIAERFKTMILKTGNETDRTEAYRAFRGRDPDATALLKRRGFPTN